MSTIPTSLALSARAAYRSVFRAARITFEGDLPRRAALESAVRETFRSADLTPPSHASSSRASTSATSPPSSSSSTHQSNPAGTASLTAPPAELLAQRIREWSEVAQFLRRNVVQGHLDSTGSYKLRVTKDTELNDNLRDRPADTLPLTPFPNRDKRRKCGDTPPEAPAFW